MAKPRVIIADTDAKYIGPFQLKFAKEFYDLVSIEVITEESYFCEMFSKPQTADILIISDRLYNASIQKHNITSIFVMQEDMEVTQAQDMNVIRIFRYSSMKDIFVEIKRNSGGVLNISNRNNQEPKVIVVTSMAGGVGTTTMALGISTCLSRNYKKVLYINTESLQTFQYYLQDKSPIAKGEVYSSIFRHLDNVYSEIKSCIRQEIFDYLPPFKTSLLSLGVDKNVFINLIEQAKASRDYDYIVVDTDTVFDEFKANIIEMADRAIYVLKQDIYSINTLRVFMSNINSNSDKFAFVCNLFDSNARNDIATMGEKNNIVISEYVEDMGFRYNNDMSLDRLSADIGINKVAMFWCDN